jgi:hypothetical protein
LLPLLLMPTVELDQRLAIVALRIDRGATIRRQVLQELLDPAIIDRRRTVL